MIQLSTGEKLIKNKVFAKLTGLQVQPQEIQMNPKSSLSSKGRKRLNVGKYICRALSYCQCLIVVGMLKEKKFPGIFQEVKIMDPKIKNKFEIHCELDALT